MTLRKGMYFSGFEHCWKQNTTRQNTEQRPNQFNTESFWDGRHLCDRYFA